MDPEQQLNPDPNQPQAMPPVQGGGGSGWVGWVVGIILVILVGGGVFYYYQYVKMPTMQKQIDDLNTQIQTLQQAKQEESTPTDETADWKTYSNDKIGLSFKYPKTYSVISDKIPSPLAKNNLKIGDGTTTFTMWVDPAGFGPFFPNISYTLAEKDNGIEIVTRKVEAPSENNSGKNKEILSNTFKANGHDYMILFTYPKNGEDQEDTFETILSTFHFTD